MKTTEFVEAVPNDTCFKYSEHPDDLRKLLAGVKVLYRFDGVRKHFSDDKDERQCIIVKITRGNRSIEFPFGMSIRDTEYLNPKPFEWAGVNMLAGKRFEDNRFQYAAAIKQGKERAVNDLCYSLLACCSSEYYVPMAFSEFCGEYGYDQDSIKAKTTWEKCLEQSSQLKRIFSEQDAYCLPR